jgi:hypothetical protein
VLSELLPRIERDEARHVGLGILHLPERLARLSPRQARRLSSRVGAIGDFFLATQLRYLEHYRTLGADPRVLVRRADKILWELSSKLGVVPGTDQPYFQVDQPGDPEYERRLDEVLPPPGAEPTRLGRWIHRTVSFGARALPS